MNKKKFHVGGYTYTIYYQNDEYRMGELLLNSDSIRMNIMDNVIFELARELFPERIKEEWK